MASGKKCVITYLPNKFVQKMDAVEMLYLIVIFLRLLLKIPITYIFLKRR